MLKKTYLVKLVQWEERLYEPYFPQQLCFIRDTVTVITIDISHCISLISLTTEQKKPPLVSLTHFKKAQFVNNNVIVFK